MENDSEAEFNGKEYCGVCHAGFFFFFLFSLVGAGVCVEERQGWCHELAIPVLSPYDEEINRWKKLSN